MRPITIFFLMVLLPIISFSGTINNTLHTAQQQAETIVATQEKSIKPLVKRSQRVSQQDQSMIQQTLSSVIPNVSPLHSTHALSSSPQMILFVSLNLPTPLLRDYLRDGHDYHIPVVIRGLMKNDMRQTLSRIQTLLQLPNGSTLQGGVMINPLWFRRYHITRVPTLIIKGDELQSSTAVTEITGNLSLKGMLLRVAQSNDVSAKQLAQTVLKKGETL